MRAIISALCLLAAGCTSTPAPVANRAPVIPPDAPWTAERQSEYERQMADMRSRADALTGSRPVPAPTPQEAELLERAITNSPDYAQALRRAAIANVNAEPPLSREGTQARQARIASEEARLSDLIEKRRRDALSARAAQDRAAGLAAARAACDAQASAVGASSYTPYSPRAGILGSAITSAMNSSAAEEQARAGCYRAYGF